MATATKKTKARSFNVDERREKVDESVVTIGGRDDLRPAPQTTALRAEMRKLGVEQAQINHKAMELAKEDDAGERLEEAAELDAQAEAVLYRMISTLLVDGDGAHPDPEWLADHVPPRLAGDLIEFLQGEDVEDPS